MLSRHNDDAVLLIDESIDPEYVHLILNQNLIYLYIIYFIQEISLVIIQKIWLGII